MPDSFLRKVAAHYGTGKPVLVEPANGQPVGGNGDLPDSWFINALAGEADELAHTASGRNARCYRAAQKLGGLIHQSHGVLTEQSVIDALTAAGRIADQLGDHPFPDEEIATAIKQGFDSNVAKTRTLPASRSRKPKTDDAEPAGREIRWTTANQIQDAIPVWAWKYDGKGRIQLGTLALFAGRPGAGKSTAARWFTAQATLGHLEGCWDGRPQRVAYIATAEESARYTITPGLRAAGADLTKVHFPTVFHDEQPVQLLSTLDEHKLTKYLIDNHITVVVCDPLMSTITASTDINKNNETRAQIQPWARIADHINGVVIGVAHLRKSGTGDVVAAITGSSAFGEVARAVFGFAKNMIDDTRVMSQHKNSTGYEDLSVTYQIESQPVTVATGESTEVGKFSITGHSELTVEDILSDSTMAGGANLECLRWLEDYLTQQGCAPSKEVKVEAHREIGVSASSVDRAANKLRVIIESRGFPRRTYWSLPDAVASYDPTQSRRSGTTNNPDATGRD